MSTTNIETQDPQDPGTSKMVDGTRLDSPEITKDSGAENPNKDMENEVVKADDNCNDVKTNEEEKEIDAKSLDQALEEQRDSGKEAFQKVIDDNVRLEHELKTTKERLGEAEIQRDSAVVDLETEVEKRKELQNQVEALQNEVKVLKEEAAAKQNGGDDTSGEEHESKENASQATEQKVKDLQVRLLRTVKDAEERDEEIRQLKSEKGRSEDIIGELKPHVDAGIFEEIMAKKTALPQKQDTTELPIKTDKKNQSKTCAII